MDNLKLSGILYIAAGAFFLISGLIGGNIFYVPLAAVLVYLGLRKIKNAPEE